MIVNRDPKVRGPYTAFADVAGAYERARPGYPEEAVRWLAGPQPLDVVDLGAGTGKLTRALIALGHRVVAVEPLDEMRAELEVALPGARALAGSAEAIPLPDASKDVVTSAQAFHWFDHDAALPEIARVLRPGGVAIVQVPHRTGVATDEDPSAGREERIRRFGQADHVRYYGDDFVPRLEKAGLDVHQIQTEMVPAELVELFRLAAYEPVWFVTPAGAPAPATAETIQSGLTGALAVVMRRMAGRVEPGAGPAAAGDAEHWRQQYLRLRMRLPVRLMLRAERERRRLLGRARRR